MKQFLLCLAAITSLFNVFYSHESFDIEYLKDYQREYVSEKIEVCSVGRSKSYMSYKAVTDRASAQYKYIQNNMTVDENTGLLHDADGFIGVALGSYFGPIGSRYYITLDSGIVLPVVKVDAKADVHTNGGCEHKQDGSVIEFVIDTNIAMDYFGTISNGYVLDGNFNNYELFKGDIVDIEKVSDEKRNDLVEYSNEQDVIIEDLMGY